MHKLFFLSIILLTITTSCKKNYTCDCTTTTIFTTHPGNVSSVSSPTNTATSTTLVSATVINATKSNAKKQCTALSTSTITPPVNCSIN